MNKDSKSFLEIFVRYSLLLAVSIPNIAIFYFIFTPVTLYAVYFLLGILFPVSLSGSTILLDEVAFVSLIPACIAGAGYYLLFVLAFSVQGLNVIKRISLLCFSFLSFFIINILRIVFLSVLYFNDSPFFEIAHEFLWYFGSIILTIVIWFLGVYFFKIKSIPFYSDLKMVYKKSSFNKK
jgi:exosortase/archaeosortase family protein